MKKVPIKTYLALIVVVLATVNAVHAANDDFKSVVKMIEQFYGVKHEGIPFIARAGMKVATTAARIKGGEANELRKQAASRWQCLRIRTSTATSRNFALR
jgi:hypothetical protein